MADAIPGVADWTGHADDLDLQYAREVFFGKSREEALSLFGANPIERAENLRWMPPKPFQYYIGAFAAYIRQEEIFDNPMAASAADSFLTLVEEKLTQAPLLIRPLMAELLPVVEYVAQNQDRFEANVAIFGNFLEAYERIKVLYENSSGR